MTAISGSKGSVRFATIIHPSFGACANAWTLDMNLDTYDISDFCTVSEWKEIVAGLKTWTATVDLKLDGSHPINATDLGTSASLTLVMDPDNGTLGKYFGTALLTGFSPSVSVDAEETQTVNFQGTGLLDFIV